MSIVWIYWNAADTQDPGWYQAKRDRRNEYVYTNLWIPAGQGLRTNSLDQGMIHNHDEYPLVAGPVGVTGHFIVDRA